MAVTTLRHGAGSREVVVGWGGQLAPARVGSGTHKQPPCLLEIPP